MMRMTKMLVNIFEEMEVSLLVDVLKRYILKL